MEGFFKKAKEIATVGLAAAALSSSVQAEGMSEKDQLKDSDSTKTEKTIQYKDSSTQQKNSVNFELYTSSNTVEGATTPTGMDNSFFNNKYGITPEDIGKIAKKFGFRTGTALEYQEDLFKYLEDNAPEVLTDIETEFGQTAAGTFKDGRAGARTAYASAKVKEKIGGPDPIEPPVLEKEMPQPNTNYVINVRGDEPGNKGAYFFVNNLADWEKALSGIKWSDKKVLAGGARAEAAVNADRDVVFDQITPEIRELLGTVWHRDPNDASKFIAEPNTWGTRDIASGK